MKKIKQLAKMGNDDKELQETLLNTSVKYISLISIAMVSSWISFTFAYTESSYYAQLSQDEVDQRIWIAPIVMCYDCVINVLCLYLQYPFNKKYYDKYCKCCGNCCWCLLVRRELVVQPQLNSAVSGSSVVAGRMEMEQNEIMVETQKYGIDGDMI